MSADASSRLIELARTAQDLVSFRRAALGVIAEHVPYESAFFHELSPRVPLERGAWVDIDPRALGESRARWDDNAVVLGRLRDLALAQGGVATDAEAFPPRTRGRGEWDRRVARPLRLRSALVAHLVVRGRVVGVVLLGRRRRAPFTRADRLRVASMLPALAVGDALAQALEGRAIAGPSVALECVDQRLTPRQREIVVQVALGHTNAEIGRALDISEHTVRNLLTQVRARLGAANRAEIVRLAVVR